MAKIKLPKNPLSMVIFWMNIRRSDRDLSSQVAVTPQGKIELAVIPISVKTAVSR